MKVLLIKSVTKHFPLGLLYLASELEKNGIDVSILDYVIGRYTPQRFKTEIAKINPDLIGISCFSFNVPPAFEIAKMAKEALPHTHIVMGGPHPSGLPGHALENRDIDSIVIGEGERTLSELVAALDRGDSLDNINGLAYKDSGRIIFNPPREYIKDVDAILFPAYYLINLDAYFEFPDPHGMATRNKRFMSILTSRGCPYLCTYCHNTLGKVFRGRSPENVLSEMELLYYKYGIREFHIEDDSFNINLARAERILDMIRERNLKITLQFPNGIRADNLNEQFVKKLKRAGTFMVAIGIESASLKILKRIKKNLDLTKIQDAVNLLVKNEILVWGYFMVGFLNETRQDIEETIEFAKKLKLHFVSFSIVIPYPGTELFETIKDQINYDLYFSGRLTYSLPQIQLSKISLKEIGEIKKIALRRFYTPIRILRIAKTISNIKEIKFYWEKFKKNILKPRFGEAQKEINK